MAERDDRRRGTADALRLFLWAWVLLGFAAYLYQFRPLAEPVIRLMERTL